jgi:hypothetical protein
LNLRGRRKWCESGEDCIMRRFVTCTLHHIIRVIKLGRTKWAARREDLGIDGRIILE